MRPITCFKAYDLRGRLGEELDEDVARRVGRGFAQATGARRVVIGRDCRLSSAALAAALAEGLAECGVEVLDLGLCGTEEVYFATSHLDADGGIEVTASHNPADYNGMKFVGRGSAPIDPAGLAAIRAAAEAESPPPRPGGRILPAAETRAAYVERVLSFVDPAFLPPVKVLVNAGNGAAGPTFDAIAGALTARGARLAFERILHAPDGRFPQGIPNPLLPGNQALTAEAVRAAGADLGIAWDGDFDRCFLFDHEGRFVPGEYIVGLLAEVFLAREPGAVIVHDPRVVWNTQDVIARAGGRAVVSRTGHAFLKAALRETGAVYGGEMSAHHYFRDFMCCDSGMIPWLLVLELMGRKGARLAELVGARMAAFPSSGEINFRVADPAAAIARIEAAFAPLGPARDETDGLSLAFADWRLNLRRSNTEPLLRLNVEGRGPGVDVAARAAEVAALIGGEAAG
ncbi:MAG: phosphomannomutase [Rhodobacteraceae bacterium]|nr:phosphomannomutase [Paracoccaceae bacterium]